MPYYMCGFIVDSNGIIIETAPILKWALGKTLELVDNWAYKKNGHVELIGENYDE